MVDLDGETAQEIRELEADDRGRVTLGVAYSDKSVRLAVLETGDTDGE